MGWAKFFLARNAQHPFILFRHFIHISHSTYGFSVAVHWAYFPSGGHQLFQASLQNSGYSAKHSVSIVFDFTFPYYKGKPACFLEMRKVIFIPHDILLKLRPPEIQTGFRRVSIFAPLMPMPETAMNKDYCPVFGENNIWSPWKGFIRNSESVPHAMQHRADSKLGLCICSSDAGHIPATFFRGQRIHAKSSAALKYHGLLQPPAWTTAGARHYQPDDTAMSYHLRICSCLEMFAAVPPP